MNITVRSEQKIFGGVQGFYEHQSKMCDGPMRFGVFLPPLKIEERAPVVYCLAGLTCNEETFAMKAGAQRVAAQLGLCVVTPDTSPRASRFDGDDASWDFGLGAGFYLDASESPWSGAYNMESWITQELHAVIEDNFSVSSGARGVCGHSMGGHGALSLALRHPTLFASVSALAPIVAPSKVPWGQKAFTNYLGAERSSWAAHDTCELLKSRRFDGELLVDQGLADKFLERELKPELLREVCETVGQSLRLRLHDGYDHSYYFIASVIEDHLQHHARVLRQRGR